MATLTEQLEALRALRARGVSQTTQYGVGAVQYRTDAELAAAISDLERRIAAADATSTAGDPIVFTSGKGWL